MPRRTPRLHALPAGLALALVIVAGHSQAQGGGTSLPALDEMRAAMAAVQPQAIAQGLQLALAPPDLASLRLRTPLQVALHGQVCRIGYTAYTPGTDYGLLFPALPAGERRVWLEALVAHELAHCLIDQHGQAAVDATTGQQAGAVAGTAVQPHPDRHPTEQVPGLAADAASEALADLAFARHTLLRLGERGRGLVERLASVRQTWRQRDPVHDTSALLRCDLAWGTPGAQGDLPTDPDWLVELKTRRDRCSPPSPAPAPQPTPGQAPAQG